MTKISDISSQSTISSIENLDKDTLENEYNWANLYGKLDSGEYEFILSIGDLGFSFIRIRFFIDENEKITYNEPILGW